MNAVQMCANFTVLCEMAVYVFRRFLLCLLHDKVGDRKWPTFVMKSLESAQPINFYCATLYNVLQVNNPDCLYKRLTPPYKGNI